MLLGVYDAYLVSVSSLYLPLLIPMAIGLFIGSIIILLLGIIGEYLARIYMEVKNRPIYIAKAEKLDENTEMKD